MPKRPDPLPLPAVLRAARAAAGLSADELAARVGVTRAAVYHYESGFRVPPAGMVARIAAALGRGFLTTDGGWLVTRG